MAGVGAWRRRRDDDDGINVACREAGASLVELSALGMATRDYAVTVNTHVCSLVYNAVANSLLNVAVHQHYGYQFKDYHS